MTPGTAVGTESMTELIFIRTKEILCFNIEFFFSFFACGYLKKKLVLLHLNHIGLLSPYGNDCLSTFELCCIMWIDYVNDKNDVGRLK